MARRYSPRLAEHTFLFGLVPQYDSHCSLAAAGRKIGATLAGMESAAEPAVTVHAPETGHFKCACGERLMFGIESNSLTAPKSVAAWEEDWLVPSVRASA